MIKLTLKSGGEVWLKADRIRAMFHPKAGTQIYLGEQMTYVDVTESPVEILAMIASLKV